MIAAFLFALTIATAIFWGGYVGSVLWGWFIVPLGVPAIDYLHAVGISCVLQTFLGIRNSSPNKNETAIDVLLESLFYTAAVPLFALMIGWLVK